MTIVCFSGHINEVKFIIKDYTSWYFRMWLFVVLNIGMRGPIDEFSESQTCGRFAGTKMVGLNDEVTVLTR